MQGLLQGSLWRWGTAAEDAQVCGRREGSLLAHSHVSVAVTLLKCVN